MGWSELCFCDNTWPRIWLSPAQGLIMCIAYVCIFTRHFVYIIYCEIFVLFCLSYIGRSLWGVGNCASICFEALTVYSWEWCCCFCVCNFLCPYIDLVRMFMHLHTCVMYAHAHLHKHSHQSSQMHTCPSTHVFVCVHACVHEWFVYK